MTRTCDEADAEPLEIVDRIAERVDLELTAVAGAGVDVSDAERGAEHRKNALLQLRANPQAVISGRGGLGDDSDRGDLAQRLEHGCRLQIVPAVGEIEGFVDERKIRDELA